MAEITVGAPIPDFERRASDGALRRAWRGGPVPERTGAVVEAALAAAA